jgi:hypothetical protein
MCAASWASRSGGREEAVMGDVARGQCVCGGVRFRVEGPLRDVFFCHCRECRRFNGAVGAYTSAQAGHLAFEADASLRWYPSSPTARRGFCGGCGASLFFERLGSGRIGIAAGCLEVPTGLAGACHWWVSEASDYYTINDGLPCLDREG